MRTFYFTPVVSAFFFSSPIFSQRRLDVYHTSIWCGLSANLECRSEMCCMRLAEKIQDAKIAPNSPAHIRTNLSGYVFTAKACIDNWNKLAKQQYLLHMCSQYGERQPTNGWDRFVSYGHPSILASLLHRRRSKEVNQTLHDLWPSSGLVHYRELLPLTELSQAQNSLGVQILRSPILAALLHGTRAVGVSQTLRRSAEGDTYIRQGGHHVGHRPTF